MSILSLCAIGGTLWKNESINSQLINSQQLISQLGLTVNVSFRFELIVYLILKIKMSQLLIEVIHNLAKKEKINF